jgi:ribosomal protein L19
MKRCLLIWLPPLTLLGVCLSAAVVAAADTRPGADDWKYDIVYRKKGDSYRGLVLRQGAGGLRMQCIVRRPNRPTIVYPIVLSANEIDHVDLLADGEREVLRKRLKALREERQRLSEQMTALNGTGREPASDKLELREASWPGDARAKALAYSSSHFRLVSNASRGIVEVAAIRLEQVYAAYVHCLPPRARGEPTTIFLPQSLADYQALVRGQGRSILNPAFFDPARNQIVCAFDWRHITEEMDRVQRHHARLEKQLDEREDELRKAYKGAVPADLKAAMEENRRQIKLAKARNHETFQRAQQRLFQRLFHEAFHAYLLNFVYPERDGELPRWLNEGLAQIFETAIFEVGELRIGHADKERLDAVRRALARNELLSLGDLLRSGAKQFQVAHDGEKQVSDRYYLASWALAYYLTFDRKVLGTPALDAYVRELKRGTDPLDAFGKLTGQPLTRFEEAFLDYLKHLRPDGSLGGAE